MGDHVFHNFVSAKKREWAEYISQVTNWEVDRYLTSY
ncbi:MAG: glutamine synthetase [Gemmatimonadota bacterium]|nr:glutamine synthetase [Gemmatimonadota bacterium]